MACRRRQPVRNDVCLGTLEERRFFSFFGAILISEWTKCMGVVIVVDFVSGGSLVSGGSGSQIAGLWNWKA